MAKFWTLALSAVVRVALYLADHPNEVHAAVNKFAPKTDAN